MIRKIFLWSIVIVSSFLALYMLLCVPDHNDPPVAIFYSPHPDDETLSMGAAIVDHIAKGYDVHIVLLTRGGASRAFESVNKRLEKEGQELLTRQAFMEARVSEFREAVAQLQVDAENIHIFDFQDGNLQTEEIRQVILDFEMLYPGARHYVFTYHDPHPDHAATGVALMSLYEEGEISEAMFFVPRYVGLEELGELVPYDEDYQEYVHKALETYGVWNPAEGRYAIGHTSIPDAFQMMMTDPRNRWHKPGE